MTAGRQPRQTYQASENCILKVVELSMGRVWKDLLGWRGHWRSIAVDAGEDWVTGGWLTFVTATSRCGGYGYGGARRTASQTGVLAGVRFCRTGCPEAGLRNHLGRVIIGSDGPASRLHLRCSLLRVHKST